ncbi:bifunctional NAD(P)H-hydrate repair enzyme Nnr [Alicyclobacillus hesperidum]|uniref:Bifunctional NAD(P)H-hydrate repair enzyme n=1 Tax=Alicyclobacillus hesperidum TaxID=89784 RepID=A0A1H2ULN1_9BACL|nr:bifunctional ADP-dependent NAD(P)H-hydrate dehydratase/NAD(P)H-hydrate epimerase [Alicyclobacillus hesperidum]GLV14372.1 bifunctional NAD(P)H-hydrate repair enzyme Nnr [Alicyclobacillus hesperidum]SDW57035.1 NAD(P)H-hydrate epimerase [Alicyclobacillus hesperidum]
MYLVTSEQMRSFDHDTIETYQVPAIVLMDHAGRAVADAVLSHLPKAAVVVCGKGNNGADGWLCARWLKRAGIAVSVVTLVDPATLQADARLAHSIADAAGVRWQLYEPGVVRETVALAQATGKVAIVDAILGTGVSRPLTGEFALVVDEINQVQAAVVAIDVPTGVNASTGEVHGRAVQATTTVAMAAEKLGTAVTPGALYAGQVRVADIGIEMRLDDAIAMYTHPALFRGQYGDRDELTHKGSFGRVGIAVGTMIGAARLAALAAAKAGVGMVVVGGEGAKGGEWAPDIVVRSQTDVPAAFADCQAVVIGPGLGDRAHRAQAWLRQLADCGVRRGAIDADALAFVAQDGRFTPVAGEYVLTPHPKEAARMLGWDVSAVQARRIEAAREIAMRSGAVALLKGYRTIIATPDGRLRVNPTGDASLAVAGTGDVLAGVVGSLLAQGLDAFAAASLGAWLHGRAGELAGQALTRVSATASDVVHELPNALKAYLQSLR